MSLFSSGDRVLSWSLSCCLSVLVLGGCNTAPAEIDPPGYEDDFGTSFDAEPITAESVGEESMLHQRSQFDLRLATVISMDEHFQPDTFEEGLNARDPSHESFFTGSQIGGRLGYEVFKDLFMGLDFSYSRHRTWDAANAGALPALRTPAQHMDEFDRYSILGNFNYDIPLTKIMRFRFGMGAGLLMIHPETAPDVADRLKVQNLYTFVLRPEVEFRWQVWKHGHVLVFTSFDWVPEENLTQKEQGERSTIGGEPVDFDAVNIGVGFSFEW